MGLFGLQSSPLDCRICIHMLSIISLSPFCSAPSQSSHLFLRLFGNHGVMDNKVGGGYLLLPPSLLMMMMMMRRDTWEEESLHSSWQDIRFWLLIKEHFACVTSLTESQGPTVWE